MPELILLLIAIGLTGYIYREYRQQKRQRYISRILALAAKKKEGFVIADGEHVNFVRTDELVKNGNINENKGRNTS
jgi:hypothetical protein